MEPTAQRVSPPNNGLVGSRDGIGAGDHDEPYNFGHRPSSGWTYPFTGRQFARLLILRGRLRDGEFADDLPVA